MKAVLFGICVLFFSAGCTENESLFAMKPVPIPTSEERMILAPGDPLIIESSLPLNQNRALRVLRKASWRYKEHKSFTWRHGDDSGRDGLFNVKFENNGKKILITPKNASVWPSGSHSLFFGDAFYPEDNRDFLEYTLGGFDFTVESVYYVDSRAVGAGTGNSPKDAFTDLEEAFMEGVTNEDFTACRIYISPGVYKAPRAAYGWNSVRIFGSQNDDLTVLKGDFSFSDWYPDVSFWEFDRLVFSGNVRLNESDFIFRDCTVYVPEGETLSFGQSGVFQMIRSVFFRETAETVEGEPLPERFSAENCAFGENLFREEIDALRLGSDNETDGNAKAPLFFDPAADDFSLRIGSPLLATDIKNNIGAFKGAGRVKQ